MGYSIELIDRNRSITEEDLDDVVKKLPVRLEGILMSKQKWGWTLITDLMLNTNQNKIQYISVSGSFSTSGHWALDMVVSLQQLLQRKGYTIEVYSTDFGFVNKDLYAWLGYDPEELKDFENF